MNQADLKKAKELSARVASLGGVSKPLSLRKPLKKIPTPFKFDYSALQIKNGKTPEKGKDYYTPQEREALKQEMLSILRDETKTPEIENPVLEVNEDVVKKIIEIMHTLPEVDKLEVSKGIRNAQSFLYGGTKYDISEMMHGGSASSTGTSVYNEVVAGANTTWTLAHTPTSGTLRLYANGQRLTETVDYSISGTTITTVTSWAAGTLLADYQYTT